MEKTTDSGGFTMNENVKYLFCLVAGFLIARYVITSKGSKKYLQEESEAIDKIRNKLHDYLARNTNMGDKDISDDVLIITKKE